MTSSTRPRRFKQIEGRDWLGFWVRREMRLARLPERTAFAREEFLTRDTREILLKAIRGYLTWEHEEKIEGARMEDIPDVELEAFTINAAVGVIESMLAAEEGDVIELDTGLDATPVTDEVIDLISGF